MIVMPLHVSIVTRLAATTGVFLGGGYLRFGFLAFPRAATIRRSGRSLAAATTTRGVDGSERQSCCWLALSQEFLPAMFAAKVKRFAVAFGFEGGTLIYLHVADRVDFHGVRFQL